MNISIEIVNGFTLGLYITTEVLFMTEGDKELPCLGMFDGLVVNLGFVRFRFGDLYILEEEGA